MAEKCLCFATSPGATNRRYLPPRDRAEKFRRVIGELASMLVYGRPPTWRRALAIETPLTTTEGQVMAEKVGLVPILRRPRYGRRRGGCCRRPKSGTSVSTATNARFSQSPTTISRRWRPR